MSQERKPKVLISAYACEPHKGSEPGVGWNWSKQIAKFAEVWVITRANNRAVIEEELKRSPEPNLHFEYIDLPEWMTFWKKGQRWFHLYYLLWQFAAYRLARRMVRQTAFNLAHHITFGNIWLPIFTQFLPVRFIWGPVGGGEQIPKGFRKEFGIKSRLKEHVRDSIIYFLRINIIFLNACKKARIIIAKTSDTAKMVSYYDSKRSKVVLSTDVAVNSHLLGNKHKNYADIKIIAAGSLEPWRGFHLLIKAFSRISQVRKQTKLAILGEGRDRQRLTRICAENNLADKVFFTGHISQDKYMQYLDNSTIFVSPCLKEGGVTALFDALSKGLPVICLDVPGSSEVITNECGIKVKPLNPEQTVNDLADALLKLANDPELRKRMGEAGRRRVEEHYTWEKKGEFIREVYEEVLKEKLAGYR